MFSVSVTNDNSKIIFIIIMAIFVFVQYQCESFVIQSVNIMEFILLFDIIFVVALKLAFYVNYTFKQYLISFLIIFPFMLFIYFLIQCKRSRLKMDNYGMDLNCSVQEDIKVRSDYLIFKEKGTKSNQPQQLDESLLFLSSRQARFL